MSNNIPYPDPEAFRETHYQIGCALWQCQSFEHTIACYITLILKLPPSRAEAEVMDVLTKMEKKTMGQLVTELKKGNSTNSVTEFEKRVWKFVEERNWLAHASWKTNENDLYHPEKLQPLFARLQAIQAEAGNLRDIFGNLVMAWALQQPGITREIIDADVEKRLRASGVIK